MRQEAAEIEVSTTGPGLWDITREVADALHQTGLKEGVATLLVQHTSASLVVQENADPAVQRDLVRFFEKIAPMMDGYEHDAEGPDDMPAHIKSALTSVSLSLPFTSGRLALGVWQGVYLFEHRTSPHRRRVRLHFIGE